MDEHLIESSEERQLEDALWWARVGLIAFMVCVVGAILLMMDRFSLRRTYLSHVGCFGSEPLRLHAWLFNVSVIFFGTTLAWLFHSLSRIGRHAPAGLKMCAVCGRGSGVALIGVGLTPVDMFYVPHMIAMSSWLLLMVLCMIGWLGWRASRKEKEAFQMARYVTYGVCIYPIAVALSYGPLLQKIIVVLAVGWLGYFFGQIDDAIEGGAVRLWLKSPKQKKKRRKQPVIHWVKSIDD